MRSDFIVHNHAQSDDDQDQRPPLTNKIAEIEIDNIQPIEQHQTADYDKRHSPEKSGIITPHRFPLFFNPI